MDDQQDLTFPLFIGAVIGAVLGAGLTFALYKTPADLKPGEDPGYVKTKDLVDLTSTAAKLIGLLDDVRRKS